MRETVLKTIGAAQHITSSTLRDMTFLDGLVQAARDIGPVALAPLIALLGVLVTLEVGRRGRQETARIERLEAAADDIRKYCEYLAERIQDPKPLTGMKNSIDVVRLVFGCWNLHLAMRNKKEAAVSKWAVGQLVAMAVACQDTTRSPGDRYEDLMSYSNIMLVGLNEWRLNARPVSWYAARLGDDTSVLDDL